MTAPACLPRLLRWSDEGRAEVYARLHEAQRDLSLARGLLRDAGLEGDLDEAIDWCRGREGKAPPPAPGAS